MNQSINFILTQLSTDEASRDRFNRISFFECRYIPRIDTLEFGGIALSDNPVKLQ